MTLDGPRKVVASDAFGCMKKHKRFLWRSHKQFDMMHAPMTVHATHEAVKDMAVGAMPQVMHQPCIHTSMKHLIQLYVSIMLHHLNAQRVRCRHLLRGAQCKGLTQQDVAALDLGFKPTLVHTQTEKIRRHLQPLRTLHRFY